MGHADETSYRKECRTKFQVKLEDEAYHERIIEYLTHEDDDYSSSWKRDAVGFTAVTDSSDSVEISFKIPVTESD